MARSVTGYEICAFSESWRYDYIGYVEGNAPIRSYQNPSWYAGLSGESFFGKIEHTFSMRVTATEKYQRAVGSEHILADDQPIEVTEVWIARDNGGDIVHGPTTTVYTSTVAAIELSIPFIRKSQSVGFGGSNEAPWFNFICGEAGFHECSAITWYGSTLDWPTLSFNEEYVTTVASGTYTGEEVFGKVHLTSGGGITCTCDGGYERNGHLRLASYHVNVGMSAQGPNSYHVKASPVDMGGNAYGAGKKAYVLFGPLYKVNAASSHAVSDIDNATYTGDVSDYCFERTLPIDETFSFPLTRVRDNAAVTITTVGIYFLCSPPMPGADISDPHPTRYQVDHEKEARSQLIEAQVVLDKADFFGLTAAVRRLANFDNQHPGVMGLHRFHSEAGATQKQVATISQAASKPLGSGSISWDANGGGSFSFDGSTMVFNTPGGAGPNYGLSNPQVWNFRPYRYLTFDYEVVSGGSIALTIKLTDNLTTKTYTASLSGVGTCNIDLCKPTNIQTNIPGQGATLMASRLATENQATTTNVTDTSYSTSGSQLKEKTTGVRGCSTVQLFLSGPSVVRINTFRKTATTGAINLNGWVQQKSETNDAGAYGHLDYKDAYRIPHSGIALKAFIDLLNTRQSMTVTHGSYTMPSTWISGSNIETLGAQALGSASVYGWFSQFDSSMAWIGPRNPVDVYLPVYVTVGGRLFRGYTAIGEGSMFGGGVLVQTEFVIGSVFEMTAFPRSVGTIARINGTSGLGTIDETYASGVGGYGRFNLQRYRPKDITADPAQTQNLEHYIPAHPTPQEKQLVFDTALRNVFWIGVKGVTKGNKLSYDVSDSQNHYRAYIIDGSVWVGTSDNRIEDWNDIDTGIQATTLCIQVEKSKKDPAIYLFIESPDGDIVRYVSTDEGATFGMATQLTTSGSAKMPAACIGRDNTHYVYFIDDGDAKGLIFDAALNEIEPEFLAVGGIDEEGLACDESVKGLGAQRIGLFVIQGGDLFIYQGENGRNFA